jgi:hypothetical protein
MPLAGHDVRDGTGFGVVWAAAHLAGLAAAGAAGATVLRWADCGTGSAGSAFWGALSARRDRGLLQVLNTGHPAATGWRWAVQGEAGGQHEDWLVHTGESHCRIHGLQDRQGRQGRAAGAQRSPRAAVQSVQILAQAGRAGPAGIPIAQDGQSEQPSMGEPALAPRSLTRVCWG